MANKESIDKDINDLNDEKHLADDEINEINSEISKLESQYGKDRLKINLEYKNKGETLTRLNAQKDEILKIYKQLNVEIFYELEKDQFYKIVLSDSNFECYNISNNSTEPFNLSSNFFYSIAVNYSLYGLNEAILGEWISGLFHKNDAYQTPLVINPYRQSGIIDVNSELHLAQTRLLANTLLTDNKEILQNKFIEAVCFRLEPRNSWDTQIPKVDLDFNLFKKLYVGIYKNEPVKLSIEKVKEVPHFEAMMIYLLHKIKKLTRIYPDYQNIIPFTDNGLSTAILGKLSTDRSHITLKIRQVLNIINYNLLYNDENVWEEKEDGAFVSSPENSTV